MSVQKRKCSSCKFFNESPLPGNGWCTHQKRQLSSDVRILVRKGELACRDPWGIDYWSPREDTAVAAEPEDMVRPESPDRLVAGRRADDQVTSVTASLSGQPSRLGQADIGNHLSSRGARPDDVIVSKPSMLPEGAGSSISERSFERDRNDLNLPAHEDQQERVRIIARGNRDAIMKARERVMLRRGGSVSERAGDQDDAHHADNLSSAGYGNKLDDNVIGSDRFADVVDVPASRQINRQSAEQRFGHVAPSRGYADPAPPVPPEEVGDRDSTIVSRRTDADRFESVPEVKPDVELPRLRTFLRATGAGTEKNEGSVPDSDEQVETSYDRVLQQAQAIKTATQKERNARVIRNRPVADVRPASSRAPVHTSERVTPASSSPLASGHFRDETVGDVPHINLSHDDVISNVERDRRDTSGAFDVEASFDDEVVDDEFYADDDSAYEDADGRSPDGPQESWWRGLNLGFRRRPHVYAAAANDSYDLDDWSDEEFTTEPDSPEHERDDEWETANGGERVFSFANASSDVSAHPSVSLRDPRSAEDELIDYELTDEVLETSFADDTDRVQAESFRQDCHPETEPRRRGAASTRRPLRDSGFALNDRHDMDAFRAALFGSDEDDRTVAYESATNRRPVQRHHEPPAVPRDEVPTRRDEPRVAEAISGTTWRRYVEEPTFDIRNFVDQDDDLLDMRVQIAPDIPRACETCRNFRPSESGERGWCTNDFAFTHRQMVNASDMPCQSSIGCWWLPSDDTWMPAEDLAVRDNPTPLTDRLIARRLGHDIRDERAYPELYVREN